MDKIRIIADDKCFIESEAVKQIESIGRLEDIIEVVGLPDLHPGKVPIGMAAASENRIYPHLIGNDIGCGMRLLKLNIKQKKFKKDKVIKLLSKIDRLNDLDRADYYDEENPIKNFGTIGSGNHFAEFQCVDKIYNKEKFRELNIKNDDMMLLIHSGSRGYGEEILNEFLNYDGFSINSEQAKAYMEKHDNALMWAERNRQAIGENIISHLGLTSKLEVIIDCMHNYIEKKNEIYIHRKGAVSSENGMVIIPGSRGDLTYIVEPKSNCAISLYSLSHGAGRKWARGLCKGRLINKYNKDTIKETKLKSSVVCFDNNLLYEEAPEAYKNIDNIIKTLADYELIDVIAVLKPVVTFKG